MDEPARHLLLHGVILLLIGLLAGIPLGRAIVGQAKDERINAWRVSHSALPMGAILLIALAALLSSLPVGDVVKWSIAVLFIISAYGFAFALTLGPALGHRGLVIKRPLPATLVFVGNVIGAGTSLLGTLVLLYAAWVSL